MRFASGHLLGLALAGVAVLVISPDALIIRLIEADRWTLLFWRGLLPSLAMTAMLAARHGRETPAMFRTIALRAGPAEPSGTTIIPHA